VPRARAAAAATILFDYLPAPESVYEYREIPGRLRARAVLSEATARRLDGLAGLRDALVHEYADVNLRRVRDGLDRLGDIDAFVADGWDRR
jgi:uncharacterized protein YutE (UPF0331/DUF86 family)